MKFISYSSGISVPGNNFKISKQGKVKGIFIVYKSIEPVSGDDESEEPVDMETETPTTSVEEVEEEVDATEKVRDLLNINLFMCK